ncbi:MAG TPA: hypothetical protein VFN57_02750 [Thermomicrobiaceae bacterium]|nr:hypothetical protein [Thermomicrobiaceae bacterium]
MSAGSPGAAGAVVGLAELRALRDRMLPMFQVVARDYETRTPNGYPIVFDTVEDAGCFGIHLDPRYGLDILTDGEAVFAQLNIVGWRTDARSSAQKEKFAALPFEGLRRLNGSMSDGLLRNLISELLAFYNTQPLMINITDS